MSSLHDRQIVCVSSVPYDFVPTSRHHLSRHLARANDVLFVDPPGNVLRLGGDIPTGSGDLIARGLWGSLHRLDGRLWRLRPTPRLPYGGNLRFRLLTPVNQRVFPWSVRSALAQLRWKEPLLWNVTMTYLAPRLDAGITPTGHVVHLTDDLWSYPWYRPEYDEFLRQELARCQMAIGSTPALVERLATYGIETHHLPHGVDIELFGPVADGKVPPPNELVNRPRPRLGLVGNIEDRIDVDLVEALAMGSGSVTLVGPVNLPSVVRQRLDRAGCFFAGPVPYHDVPKWLAGLDVALVPYRTTELIRRSRPLKLLDYLAAGRPVVSTDMPAARELEPHVTVASSRSEYVDAVEDIWRRRDVELELEARRRRRDAVAKESWTQRGEELEALFERALQLAPR